MISRRKVRHTTTCALKSASCSFLASALAARSSLVNGGLLDGAFRESSSSKGIFTKSALGATGPTISAWARRDATCRAAWRGVV